MQYFNYMIKNYFNGVNLLINYLNKIIFYRTNIIIFLLYLSTASRLDSRLRGNDNKTRE